MRGSRGMGGHLRRVSISLGTGAFRFLLKGGRGVLGFEAHTAILQNASPWQIDSFAVMDRV